MLRCSVLVGARRTLIEVLREKTMTEPRESEHHPKVHQGKKYHGVASAKGGAAASGAGRTAYREQYQRDYGPDLDEPLDGAESGLEVSTPARQAAPF